MANIDEAQRILFEASERLAEELRKPLESSRYYDMTLKDVLRQVNPFLVLSEAINETVACRCRDHCHCRCYRCR